MYKTKRQEEHTFKSLSFPSWALDYFVNGELDGYSDEEIKLMQSFEKENDVAIVSTPDGDWDEHFSWYPEFGAPCMAVECTVVQNAYFSAN